MSKTQTTSSLKSSVNACFKLTLLTLSLLLISNLLAQEKRDHKLQQVYQRMDERAKTFRSFTAKINQKRYTALLKEFDTPEIGEFCYKHAKDGTPLLRLEFTSPGKVILTIKNGVATVYRPATNEAQIKNLGKNKEIAEYLAIGLGQSPAKLEKTFDIS